jgi:hypothetical protein
MPVRPSLRNAIVMILAGASIGGSAFRDDAALPAADRQPVMLLYVGADDCPPCRAWQLEARPKFQASAEFAAVTYREVKSPRLLDLLKDEYWPDELRSFRDQLDRRTGVPVWFIVFENGIVERSAGVSQWQSTVLPKVRSLLR